MSTDTPDRNICSCTSEPKISKTEMGTVGLGHQWAVVPLSLFVTKSITSGSCTRGRIAEHNVFKEKSGPISYAKRNIENGYAISSGRLLIDEPMLHDIKNCTEEEAHRQMGKNEWSTTLDELDTFISILYARCIYGTNNIELDSLWSVVWGPSFFCDTTARNRFRDLMKFLRFDKTTT
ncbi:uncharacterized protein TNCV_3966031 [Trichonephila clavipes]|nr:uncharacterized protein TNCV_3966031 [Trichonephila clavipes]